MIKKNFKEEFDAILTVRDGRGTDIGFPAFDFRAVFYTNEPARCYTASCIGGECVNCHNDGDKIHVVFNRHGLLPGIIKCRFESLLPNGIYPDGNRCVPVVEPLNIELTFDASDMPSEVEIAITIPAFKGDPFKYSDFTPAQLDDLRRPAVEAAEKADAATADATAAAIRAETGEAARQKAEEARIAAEAQRAEAEAARRDAEAIRLDAEKTRATAEAERKAAENTRKAGEGERASAETERQAEERTRRTAEAVRIAEEVARATAETQRRNAEESRRSAESARANAEQTRTSSETARQNAEQTRSSAEALRRDAETARQSAETARAKAEAARATEFAGFEDAIAAKLDKAVWDGEHAQFNIVGYYSVYTGKTGTAYTWRRTPLIVLNRNAPIVFRNLVLNSDAGIVFFDADRRFISGMGVDSGLNDSQQIAVADFPEDAVYVGLSTFVAGSGDNHNASYSNGETVESREGAIAERIIADRKKENAQFGIAGYCHHSGSFSSASGYQRSGYLPINRKYDIRVYGHGTSIVCAIGFYDATFKFVGGLTYSGSTQTVTCAAADIPATAVYFVASTAENITGSYWRNGETMEAREGGVSEAIERSKIALFVDEFNAKAESNGKYDPTHAPDAQHPFYLNELWLTYDEAVDVYERGVTEYPLPKPLSGTVKTNLFIETRIYMSTAQTPLNNLCAYAFALERVRVSSDYNYVVCTSLVNAFWGCPRLREVLGVIDVYNTTNLQSIFNNCGLLETIYLRRLRYSVMMDVLESISLASLQYLVDNAVNTSAITVTVHPDVYAKLTNTDGLEDYLPANMVKTQRAAVGYSPNCAYDNGVWTIQRQDRDTWIEFAGEPVASGLPYAVSMNVDGMETMEYWSFTFGSGDMKSGAFRMQQGPSSGVLYPKVSRHDVQLDDGSRSYVDMSLTTPITVTDIMVVPGETAAPKWAPHPDEIEDAELRERVKWANLVYVAAAKNISFASV